MKLRAYAKLNIGLDVTGTRDDGYHLLNMVMQTVDVYDELELEPRDDGRIVVTCNDPNIPTDDRCLVAKAIRKLTDVGMDVTLRTHIPTEAGMGGGSSDAAAALIAVNEMLGLGKTKKELAEIAVLLGADVPYFIYGGTLQCEGIGEQLTRLKDMPDCWFVIVKPSVGACTENIYKALDDSGFEHADMTPVLEAIEEGDLVKAASNMDNVLETVTLRQLPVIEDIKTYLKSHGALGTSMTGSGSATFGIFTDEESARRAAAAFAAEFESKSKDGSESRGETSSEIRSEAKSETKSETGSEIRSEAKSEAKSETRSETRSEAVLEFKSGSSVPVPDKTDYMPDTVAESGEKPTYNIYVVKNTKKSQIFC